MGFTGSLSLHLEEFSVQNSAYSLVRVTPALDVNEFVVEKLLSLKFLVLSTVGHLRSEGVGSTGRLWRRRNGTQRPRTSRSYLKSRHRRAPNPELLNTPRHRKKAFLFSGSPQKTTTTTKFVSNFYQETQRLLETVNTTNRCFVKVWLLEYQIRTGSKDFTKDYSVKSVR